MKMSRWLVLLGSALVVVACAAPAPDVTPEADAGTSIDAGAPDGGTCPTGFTGPDCQTNIDDCAANPCEHGGTCVDGIASFTCTCQGGWTGDSCGTCGSLTIEGDFSADTSGALAAFCGQGCGDIELKGSLSMDSTSLTSLEGLECLTKVGGSINISGNTALTSLKGLENLRSVGGWVSLKENGALTNVDALNGIESLDRLEMKFNAIASLPPFDQLTALGGLSITFESKLQAIDGFNAVTSMDGLYLDVVSSLETVLGFQSLTSVSETIDISDNGRLKQIDGLLGLKSAGAVEIGNNGLLQQRRVEQLRDAVAGNGGQFHAYGNGPCVPGCSGHGSCSEPAAPASFLCACDAGFTGERCETDVDECTTNPHSCDLNAACTNTVGSYSCDCLPAYEGDGTSCAPKFLQLAPGPSETCVVRGDHSLWCWGDNSRGQLGDGTKTAHSTPTQVGTDMDWALVATRGYGFTCAIKTTGTLWCWGSNDAGQLGQGDTTERLVPAQIGSDADWKSLSTGFNNSNACALRTDGSLWCWGNNDNGQLGDGTTTNRSVPTHIGTDIDWKMIDVSDYSACALKTNGTLWCTGLNVVGSLGDGTTTSRTSWLQSGTETDWATLAAGDGHSCATKTSGSLWCWGFNLFGQTGRTGTFGELSPVQVGTDTDWTAVVAGGNQSCGVKQDGAGWCWGSNSDRQLGNGVPSSSAGPGTIAGGHHWLLLSTGNRHSCGVADDGALYCWGADGNGLLGTNIGAVAQSATPIAIAGSNWKSVESGRSSVCAIQTDDSLWCWGSGGNGILGNGTTVNRDTPTAVSPGTAWRTVTVGELTACGIQTNGTLWCWGYDGSGQLGQGSSSQGSAVPLQVGTDSDWTALAVGQAVNCGLKGSGELWCWGGNRGSSPARLGLNLFTTMSQFTLKLDLVKSDGTLWQLNGGDSEPGQISSDTDWQSITNSFISTCAIKTSGALYCWGSNPFGQLGTGDTNGVGSPVEIQPGTTWRSVDTYQMSFAGAFTAEVAETCGVQTNGTLWCWGRSDFGALGLGAGVTALTPTQVGTATNWSSFSLGERSAYGVHADGTLWSWGQNNYAQLGVGGIYAAEPVAVLR